MAPKSFLCLVLVSFAVQNTGAEIEGPVQSNALFELNTDMIGFVTPSTRFFLCWQENVNELFQVGLAAASGPPDLLHSDQWLWRSGVLSVFIGIDLIVARAFSLTAHDESHMEAARAVGASSVGLVRTDTGQEMSLGEFFWEAFDFTSEPGLYVYVKENATPYEEAYVAGEGLDTNMLIADAASRKINEGTGHVMNLAPYLLNKLWGITYFLETGPTSDAANYVDLLKEQGYSGVTANGVIFLNTACCLLSGGFLGLMRGAYDFVEKGESKVKPLGLRLGEMSFFWPELTTWLNPDNVSVRVLMDGSWKDFLSLRAGIDSPVLGNTRMNPELTLGVEAEIRPLTLGMEVTSHFAGLPFFLGSAELALGNSLSAGIQGFYGEKNTMRELREYPLGPGVLGFVRAMF